MLIFVHNGVTLAGRYRDRDDLVVELPGFDGCRGALLGLQCEYVLLVAPYLVLAAKVLSGLEHSSGNGVVLPAGGHSAPGKRVVQLDAAAANSPPRFGGVQRGSAHAFHA